jgi:enoyl-CoA hydratase
MSNLFNAPESAPSDLVKWSVKSPGVLLLELNRPEKLNALSKTLLESLAKLLRTASESEEVRCVVLTGSRKAFSVGADIHDMAKRGAAAYLDQKRLESWRVVEAFPKPLIAAVNGYALGGGCELMMLCDIAIAGEEAKFGQPEITIASIPGDGGTQRLPRSVGKSMAMQLVLTGELFTALQMQAAGLVSEVVPEGALIERALELAVRITELPPVAMRLAKASIMAAYELPLAEGLAYERQLVEKTFSTEDRAEGLAAFLEKRKPNFSGR